MTVRLLPQLPRWTLGGIDLVEWEIAPVDIKLVAEFLADMLQPDRCTVDVGSTVVEEEIEADAIGHRHGTSGVRSGLAAVD